MSRIMRTKKEEIEMIVDTFMKNISCCPDGTTDGPITHEYCYDHDHCDECWTEYLQDHIPETTIEDLTGQGRM